MYNTIVSTKIAYKLAKCGFDEMCENGYGTLYTHNGEYIGEDEEYELRAEGRGNEIEITPYAYLFHFYTKNSIDDGCISAPYVHQVITWLFETHGIYVEAKLTDTSDGCMWLKQITYVDRTSSKSAIVGDITSLTRYTDSDAALLDGIDFVLNELMPKQEENPKNICDKCMWKCINSSKCFRYDRDTALKNRKTCKGFHGKNN